MIYLTRLNGERIVLNTDLIEFMEKTPDTVVTLTTGKKFVVREPVNEIVEHINWFKRKQFSTLKD
ncbi:flagellar protein flbd [hydrocarbon metagenome]|uniref:Flagellar protein flbd n=1 Tax=hydrocarbon metagenome TaxID=938273 RepID=A0A0W8E4L5_9ZZZZ